MADPGGRGAWLWRLLAALLATEASEVSNLAGSFGRYSDRPEETRLIRYGSCSWLAFPSIDLGIDGRGVCKDIASGLAKESIVGTAEGEGYGR